MRLLYPIGLGAKDNFQLKFKLFRLNGAVLSLFQQRNL